MRIIIQDKLLFPEILKKWPLDVHKKQRAKIMVIAGFKEMIGAAALTAQAAYQSGAGIVMLAVPENIEKYYRQIPFECLILPCPQNRAGAMSLRAEKLILEKSKEYDVVILGPGLSKDRETQKLVQRLVTRLQKPLILDADGLNAMVGKTKLFASRKFPTILTPHEGEMARLCGVSAQEIHQNRQKFACEKAKKWGVVLVLKGYETIIACNIPFLSRPCRTRYKLDVNNNQFSKNISTFSRSRKSSDGIIVNSRIIYKGRPSSIYNAKIIANSHISSFVRPSKKVRSGFLVVNKSGGPALATAGTGDVLSGIIAALWAENLDKPFKSAATAVFLHGLAGDLAAKEFGVRSVVASDVVKFLPKILKNLMNYLAAS